MKMKRILTIALASAFLFASVLPAFAAEGDAASVPEQEEVVQTPEDEPAVSDPELDPVPLPDESQEPTWDSDQGLPPETAGEGEDVPPASDDLQNPGAEETPDESGSEAPGVPETPEEAGDSGAEGELPEDAENPGGEDAENPEEEYAPSSEEEAPIINVLVPERGQVIINPYRMKVDLPDGGESQEQIVNPVQTLINLSTVPVQVDAFVAGILSSESMAQFVSLPPISSTTAKEIFMYAEFQTDPFLWSGWYEDAPNQILVSAFGADKTNVMTLAPGTEGYFRLFGSMTDFPAEMWDAVDAPDVIVTFSFTPIMEENQTDIVFPEDIPEEIPEEIPGDIPGDIPEDIPEEIPEEIPGDIPGNIPGEIPGDGSGDIPEDIPLNDAVLPSAMEEEYGW